MEKIVKILLPTDLSEVSLAAMDYAYQLALKSRAHIYLLHIIGESSTSADPESCGSEDSLLSCTCTLQQKLDEAFFFHLHRYENIACVIRRGDASAQILKFATEEKIDLIIMTTHGKGYLSDTIVGTVAEEIMHHTNVPIILVQPKHVQTLVQDRKEWQL